MKSLLYLIAHMSSDENWIDWRYWAIPRIAH